MFRKENLTNMCGCDSVTDKQYKHQLNCGCDNPNQYAPKKSQSSNHMSKYMPKYILNCGCDDPQTIANYGIQKNMMGGGDVDIDNHLYPKDEQYSPFSDIGEDSPEPVYNDTYDNAIKYEDVQQKQNHNHNQTQTQTQTGGSINNVNNLRRDIANRMIFDDKLVGKTMRQLKYMKSKNDYLTLFD